MESRFESSAGSSAAVWSWAVAIPGSAADSNAVTSSAGSDRAVAGDPSASPSVLSILSIIESSKYREPTSVPRTYSTHSEPRRNGVRMRDLRSDLRRWSILFPADRFTCLERRHARQRTETPE